MVDEKQRPESGLAGASTELESVLAEMLGQAQFDRSHLLRRVLRFLVSEEIAGRGESLTPYRVAVEGFGKPSDFDPALSASVRVEMGRLRRQLASYHEQHPDLAWIEIPPASYRPRVRRPAAAARASLLEGISASTTGPCICVMGFEPVGQGASQLLALMGRGLARRIYEELARYRWLHVIDAHDLKGSLAQKIVHCQDRFACRYVLRGQIHAEPQARLRLELVDVSASAVIWEHSTTLAAFGEEGAGFSLSVQIARALADPLGAIARSAVEIPDAPVVSGDADAASLLLLAQVHEGNGRPPLENASLIERFRALLARRPDFAKGWCILGSLLLDRAALIFDPASFAEALREAEAALHCALGLDAMLADAAFALSVARYLQRDVPGFHGMLSLSLELGPNHLEHYHFGGTLLCLSGEVQAGLELIARGRLGRHQAPLFRISMAAASFAAGRMYEASVALADLPPEVPVTSVGLVRTLVLAESGDEDGARPSMAEFLAADPAMRVLIDLSIERWILDPVLAARIHGVFRRVLGEPQPSPGSAG